MKTSQGILLSVAVLGLLAAPSAQAGFLFFGHNRAEVVVRAPAPPVVIAPEVIVERPAPPAPNCVVVVPQPPAPIRELVPARPAPNLIWVGGYWSWNNSSWTWVRGNYQLRPSARAVYVPGHWQHYRDQGYRYVTGAWRL